MMVVAFIVTIKNNRQSRYLKYAAELYEKLKKEPGFIAVERFSSLTEENKLLSLSFWQDEASVTRWRNNKNHREKQWAGKKDIFEHYEIKVMQVTRSYSLNDRGGAPEDSQRYHLYANKDQS